MITLLWYYCHLGQFINEYVAWVIGDDIDVGAVPRRGAGHIKKLI